MTKKHDSDIIEKTMKGTKAMGFWNDLKNIFTNGEPVFMPPEMWDKSRGTVGEYRTDYVLNNDALKELSYLRTISNVYVENNGNYTEIDVIALTEKGIYVMESKNYKGWIYGRAEDTNWTQCFKNGEKYKFYNPVKQNEGHINKLSQYLGVDKDKMFSFIIFSDLGTLKSVPAPTSNMCIINRYNLLWVMKSELNRRPTIFTRREINELYAKLLPLTQKTEAEKQQHIDRVKGYTTGDICPYCQKPLRLINGPYGKFYGCTGYPNCKFKRKA